MSGRRNLKRKSKISKKFNFGETKRKIARRQQEKARKGK